MLAVIVAALPRRQPEPDFQISTPLPDSEFSDGELVVVSGVVPDSARTRSGCSRKGVSTAGGYGSSVARRWCTATAGA